MTKSLDEILAEPKDSDVGSGLVDLILAHYGSDLDLSALPQAEQVVVFVTQTSGIIGNGGFRYLFEGDYPEDPYFVRAVRAFEIIGSEKAAKAFRDSLAYFPNSHPPRDTDERLKHYLKQVNWPSKEDDLFFSASDEIDGCLARFIRSHSDAYRHLKANGRTADHGVTSRPSTPRYRNPLDDLPHWKRVAFAARCARRVLPLVSRYWPDIPFQRAQAPLRAIELAEQSAAEEAPAPGIHDARVQAAVTCGAALLTNPDWPIKDEPKPRNAHEGTIASKAVKAAEKAAEAAESSPDESASLALDAWSFAREAAESAEDEEMVNALNVVMAQLRPADDGAFASEEKPETSALVQRGRWLVLACAAPLVLIEALTILLAFSKGWEAVRWWRDVIGPAGSLLCLLLFWQGDRTMRWLVPLGCFFTAGIRLYVTVSVLVRLARVKGPIKTEVYAEFLDVLGWWTVVGLIYLVAGLVLVLSPSVRAFLRYQYEANQDDF